MKPKPLSALNHFTVPTVMNLSLPPHLGGTTPAGPLGRRQGTSSTCGIAKLNVNLCRATVAAGATRLPPRWSGARETGQGRQDVNRGRGDDPPTGSGRAGRPAETAGPATPRAR